MKINTHKDSHLDHVTEAHVEFVLGLNPENFTDGPFYVFTVEMPDSLESLPCGLYGPIVGDGPVKEKHAIYKVRNGRTWASRMIAEKPRPSRLLSVIAGPHPKDPDAGCIIHTIYGGPIAPQETGDIYMPDEKRQASIKFWGEHALAV